MEAKFDPNSAAEIRPAEGELVYEIVDKAGRKATVKGTKVALVDGRAELQMIAGTPPAAKLGALFGKVVDEQGRALADARVGFQGAVLPQFYGGRTRTNSNGEFRIENILRSGFGAFPPDFQLVVIKDGYAGVETATQRFRPDDHGLQKLEQPVVLKRGYSARVRVLDNDGEPVEGAWVMPRICAQLTKTNLDGRATLRNLPERLQPVQVLYGAQSILTRVAISTKEPDAVTTFRLRPPPENPAEAAEREAPKLLKAGEEAPEWTVTEWTDGKTHKLSDFRGKVVVLEFWGVWCSPCINGIPAIKQLQKKYRNKDVVFIGMHTAGTDMSQIRSLLELKEWNMLTAIEEGTDQTDSATSTRYGVRGYPTTVIIDRHGRISQNSSDDNSIGDQEKVMAKAEALAKEAGLPWPIGEDWPEEKVKDWSVQMTKYSLSKEIEKALAID
jgi:thiol-disulfide isomerase/thioredoxin